MPSKDVTLRIVAKDDATGVVDRMAENVTQRFKEVSGSSKSLAEVADRLQSLGESFKTGSISGKEYASGLEGATSELAKLSGEATEAFGTVKSLYELYSKFKLLAAAGHGSLVAGVAIPLAVVAYLAKVYADDYTREQNYMARDAGKAPIGAMLKEREREKQQNKEDRANALFDALSGNLPDLNTHAGLRNAGPSSERWAEYTLRLTKETADYNAKLAAGNQSGRGLLDSAGERLRLLNASAADKAEAAIRKQIGSDRIDRMSIIPAEDEERRVQQARKIADETERAERATKQKLDDEQRISRLFDEMSGRAEEIVKGFKSPLEKYKEAVEEIHRLGQQDMLDWPEQQRAIEELKRNLPGRSPQEQFRDTAKDIEALRGVMGDERTNRAMKEARDGILGAPRHADSPGGNLLESRLLTRGPGGVSPLLDVARDQLKQQMLLVAAAARATDHGGPSVYDAFFRQLRGQLAILNRGHF